MQQEHGWVRCTDLFNATGHRGWAGRLIREKPDHEIINASCSLLWLLVCIFKYKFIVYIRSAVTAIPTHRSTVETRNAAITAGGTLPTEASQL